MRRAWATHKILAGTTGAFALALVAFGLGLVLDPRTIAGSQAWLKPAKFAASFVIYCGTLLWLLASVSRPAWGMRRAGSVVAWNALFEVGIVVLQVARGTTSHFNVGTPLDAGLWAAMGVSVLVLVVASTVFAVGLFRSPVSDRAWAWALRLGMTATVIGSVLGGLMVRPTAAQRAEIAVQGLSVAVGSHTVGATDGGAGLPGVGWSRDHGDLRIPHFFGLHAVQAIPLLAWLAFRLLRPARESTRLALVFLATASYAGLVALLTAGALAGRSVLQFDAMTGAAVGGWVALSVLGLLIVMASERSRVDDPTPLTVGA